MNSISTKMQYFSFFKILDDKMEVYKNQSHKWKGVQMMNDKFYNFEEIKVILEKEFNQESITTIATFALIELHKNNTKSVKKYLEKLKERQENSIFYE